MNLRIYFILLIFFFTVRVKSQQLFYKKLGLEEGLPSSSVYSIYQDKNGFIWLGTEGGGLSKYSGSQLITYSGKDKLQGISIRAINEDSRGNIVFGNTKGLHYFNGKIFKNILLSDLGADVVISAIKYNPISKTIWVGTAGSGIYLLKETVSGFEEIKHIVSENLYLQNSVFDLEIDKNGNVFTAYFNGCIEIYSASGTMLNSNSFNDRNFLCLHIKKSNGEIYAGTLKGAFKLEVTKNLTLRESASIREIEGEAVYDISNQNGKTLFATENKGVYFVSENEAYFLNKENGLPVNYTYKLLSDSEGNFWFGTIGGGLVSFQNNAFSFLGIKEGMPENGVFNIVETSNPNEYFIATFGSGIKKLKLSPNHFTLENISVKLPDLFITDLEVDSDNNLWFASKNSGAGYWNGKEIKAINTESGLLSDNVNCILADSKKRYWFGTSAGLNLLENGELKKLTTDNGLCNDEVQTLFEDSKGNVWIGTLSGMAKIDDNSFSIYDEKEGLNDKTIYAITEDNNGFVYAGTFGGGVYRFKNSQKGKSWKRILSDEQILSNNVYSLGYNKVKNQLVIGTDKGASIVTLNNSEETFSEITSYVKNNGFLSQETNLNALLVEKNKLIFGTNSGLTLIDLDKLATNKKEIPLHITDLHLFYTPFLPDTLANRFSVPDKLEFTHEKNHLTFYFEGVSYSGTNNLNYSYKLEGIADLDSNWSPITSTNFVTFSALKPGKYIFKVRIKGTDGKWQQNVRQIEFTILPPFYLTWWFISLCVFILVSAIVLFVKWRGKVLKEENIRLELTVQERTKEVVIQKNEAQKQKELVEEKQKEILDSISYAKRLQNAILPPASLIKQFLPDSFILYCPKDIVAGDFYCFEKINQKIVFAAADCTGHGVPGALVSVVCSNAINAVLKETDPDDTGGILDKVRKMVVETFAKSESEVKDGMDISLACIDTETMQLSWSGANNPLWFISGTELNEVTANKQPIGLSDNPKPFDTKRIQLKMGDMIFLFTDGYADQFGGPRGKKFKYKPLKELLLEHKNLPMEELCNVLNKNFTNWKGELEQVDDVCIFGVRL